MTRRHRPASAVAIALTALALCAGPDLVAAQAASTAARPVTACTPTSGVIVAVDFAHWGGPVLRACGSTPTTGYDLLNQGGWRTAGDEHDGPAFICRIGYDGFRRGTQYPTPAQQSCIVTPPATAYWTSWQAGPGQDSWSYSQLGAMSQRPAPGTVDLWVFGGTNISGTAGSAVPAVSPDRIRTDSATRPGSGAADRTLPIVNASPSPHNAAPATGSPTATLVTLALVLLAAFVAVVARRRSLRLR